jgi:hypothetical protein
MSSLVPAPKIGKLISERQHELSVNGSTLLALPLETGRVIWREKVDPGIRC